MPTRSWPAWPLRCAPLSLHNDDDSQLIPRQSAGFATAGHGTHFIKDGGISLTGKLPLATFGGLKARGHPVGASGVYQAVEAYLQLTGRAGLNQVHGAKVGMLQNIGGTGATISTHVLVAE